MEYKYSNNLLYVLTILESIEKCFIYTKNYSTSSDFFKAENQLNFNATCHLLLAIGEETKKIDIDLKEEFSFIAWDEITGIRNRIAHDYRGIDSDIIFQIVKAELSILREACIKMVELINPNEALLKRWFSTPYYTHINYLLHNK